MKTKYLATMLFALFLVPATQAVAYVGPGAGISFLSTLLGLLVALFSSLFVVIFYPIRKLLRARKGRIKNKEKVAREE